jgi:hypothetical protein
MRTRQRTAPAAGAGCSGESVKQQVLMSTSLTSDAGGCCLRRMIATKLRRFVDVFVN